VYLSSGLGGDDRICGNAGNNIISCGAGNDFLDGSVGNDEGNGGSDIDTCVNVETATSCEA